VAARAAETTNRGDKTVKYWRIVISLTGTADLPIEVLTPWAGEFQVVQVRSLIREYAREGVFRPDTTAYFPAHRITDIFYDTVEKTA
jgi:hypothetical protein